ncbi:FMN-dependent oxidoreductase (nitrilotriacetate monooxygenase family) [Sphingomonas zeicaulis]|uniref:NtaA/DmoA family FMN-dependent monooxygenase n=1 Tax=Sphingomonas zeicaulis TaxID=1632740 RepID=UPI003D218958
MAEFHLGWFLGPGITVQGWNEPGYAPGYDWTKPDIFQDAARALERACFDLLILEDTSAVPYAYGGSMDYYLRTATMTPKLDPVILTPYLAQATKRLGLAVTMTSTFYPPWLLARSLSTMDHYSNGRIAWNIVTATSDAAAQNYGYDKQFEHDLRYDMADEYVDLCSQLWDAWEEDAVVMDPESGLFVDPEKVKAINFEGKFYKSRGPLNVPRSPQGRPVFVAPGGSPRGRKFSGRNADVVLATSGTMADMKKYRDDVRGHAVDFGRDPDSLKVMYAVTPILVNSRADVADKKAALAEAKKHHMEKGMAAMSFLSGIDFSKFDLDAPIGEIKTNGMQTMLQTFAKHGPQATLRQIMTHSADDGFNQMVGTPEMVAEMMKDIVDEVGGDGFLIAGHFKPSYVSDICDRLVPELQRRGLTRTTYQHETFRDNLMAF